MKNIIITGGELFNKGAQAMTFVTVDAIKKRFPDHEIYLLSPMDMDRSEDDKSQYAFSFLGWNPIKFARSQSNPLLHTICRFRNREELLQAEQIYKNTDLMIDVSGYGLGSVWSSDACNNYLDHLEFAKAFDIPVYLMPQSFGPFVFTDKEGRKVDQRIRELLPTAKIIFAREQEGYDELINRYQLNNVRMAPDLVLNSNEIDKSNIYINLPDWSYPMIEPGSIGIIPNERLIGTSSKETVIHLFTEAVAYLLNKNHTIYLMTHSTSDAALCRIIKNNFETEEGVILIEEDLNCFQFNEIVNKFSYVIAARFHAIVHALKNSVPCIAVGWAAKYENLLAQFDQEKYMIDIRSSESSERLIDTIHEMDISFKKEVSVISERLAEIRKSDVFDAITTP